MMAVERSLTMSDDAIRPQGLTQLLLESREQLIEIGPGVARLQGRLKR